MIIGLTQRVFYHNGQAYDATDQAWYKMLSHHTLIPIANRTDTDVEKITENLDAVILTGGNDPRIRRITETRIASSMLLKRKPIIGICHGAFLLTDLMEGTVSDVDGHYNTEHNVYINGKTHTVNSHHSLKIETPPPGVDVIAVDDEGNCEAWQYQSITAMVWHPERMATPFLPNDLDKLLL